MSTTIPLPKGTVVQRDDTSYAAIALVEVAINNNAVYGHVLVVNVNGEMFSIPIHEVIFAGLSLKAD